jgi:hypothetical protein
MQLLDIGHEFIRKFRTSFNLKDLSEEEVKLQLRQVLQESQDSIDLANSLAKDLDKSTDSAESEYYIQRVLDRSIAYWAVHVAIGEWQLETGKKLDQLPELIEIRDRLNEVLLRNKDSIKAYSHTPYFCNWRMRINRMWILPWYFKEDIK